VALLARRWSRWSHTNQLQLYSFLQGAGALPNKPFIFIFPFSGKKYSVLLVHLARFVQTGGDSV